MSVVVCGGRTRMSAFARIVGFHVVGIDVYEEVAFQGVDGYNQLLAALDQKNFTSHALERTMNDLHVLALYIVDGVTNNRQHRSQQYFQVVDLVIGDGDWQALEMEDFNHAKCFQDLHMLFTGDVHEYIAGNERQPDLLFTVAPLPECRYQRQVMLNVLFFECFRHLLLCTGTGINGIPFWDRLHGIS